MATERSPQSLGDAIDERCLLAFFLLVFGFAWSMFALFIFATDWVVATFGELSGSNPLFILAVYAPMITAFLLIAKSAGIAGLGRFLSRLFLWRAPPWWYTFLLFGFPVISFSGAALKGSVTTSPLFTESLVALLPAIGFMMILGPMEEFGWRGFALPILQRRFAPFWAALILGVIWAVWHLPAFSLSGTPQATWAFTPFFLGSVACSLILAALFNATRGSVLLSMMFHFQMNNPLWPDAQPYDMFMYVGAAVIIVWLNRRVLFSSDQAVTDVVPAKSATGTIH